MLIMDPLGIADQKCTAMRSSASARAISAEEGPSLLRTQPLAVEDGKAATQDLLSMTFFEVFYR